MGAAEQSDQASEQQSNNNPRSIEISPEFSQCRMNTCVTEGQRQVLEQRRCQRICRGNALIQAERGILIAHYSQR